MAEQLARHKIQGLVVIGGFEAFHAVLQLHEQREKFKQFRIPMVSTRIMSLRKEVNNKIVTFSSDYFFPQHIMLMCVV